jgi:AraC family transcriptional regulator, regulatory protein of adaptative response / methylated-DNA-[protein]-cysteine methyltransferase
MSERIQYGRGESSLGRFLVATSEQGVVYLEFEDTHSVERLRERFPDALLEEGGQATSELAEALGRLVDHPEQGHEIALDLRGTDFQKAVWTMVREIPAGETTNYGALAARLGTRDARDVTDAVASNSIAVLIPCHRVIKKDGSISGYRWGVRRKKALLERERRAASDRPV